MEWSPSANPIEQKYHVPAPIPNSKRYRSVSIPWWVFFQPFVSQKLRYISEINILFKLSHIQHVSSSSIPIGAGSPNWIGEWESGCRNRWVRQWRRFYKLKLMLEKRVKVIFKVLEDTKADLVGFEKQHESTKLTKKNKKFSSECQENWQNLPKQNKKLNMQKNGT